MPGAPRPGWKPAIDPAKCTGCGWCVGACPPHVLSLDAQQWSKKSQLHDAARCTGCSDCAVVCPFHAISMRKGAPISKRDAAGQATIASILTPGDSTQPDVLLKTRT